jgi:CheY-like chemotaxis protein
VDLSTDSDDNFLFEEDTDNEQENELQISKVNLLIVDDEAGVHDVTKLALRNYSFNGIGLNILSVYSGEAAIELLQQRDDIAIILLDVVMESNDAGLKVANWIRHVKRDHRVRIVLRTGQPGDAPEERVMLEYDINDYKEKTELTNRKLHTLMHACLRAYNDIVTIEETCNKLTEILRSENSSYQLRPVESYSNGVINLLMDLMTHSRSYLYASYTNDSPEQALITCSSGHYNHKNGSKLSELVDLSRFTPLLTKSETGFIEDNNQFLGYVPSESINYLIVLDEIEYLQATREDVNIVELFMHHIAQCYRK